jgi:hypothetical protein
MTSRPSRRAVQRLGIGLTAVSLAMLVVGTVTAGSGSPATIGASPTGALTVQASGTWSWAEMATNRTLSYTGYAIDWGDVTSGNALGTFHIGDGTPATNVVLQPTSPAQGISGLWGPLSHTYAAPGIYTVCVIIYDLGEVTPFKTTGYHSLKASGTSRNSDNSVDNKQQVPSMCTKVDLTAPSPSASASASATAVTVTAASPSPFESFQGITSDPFSPPPTGTVSPPDQKGGLPTMPLFLLIGSFLTSLFVLRTVKVSR